ncbi:hypothetical protein [Paenibacillus puerhi]|uniref:hypothetical protein n=1 Tax=Paenibacillus puerhi TaxID=2692622 RepID=UPI0013574428|nr:hypothetical protein [Paenibacillus puerhi]
MKHRNKGLLLVAAVSLSAAIFVIGDSNASKSNISSKIHIIESSHHDFEELKEMGMQINDNISKLNNHSISAKQFEDAVDAAKTNSPGFAEQAKIIEVEYHNITNSEYRLFSDEALKGNPKLSKDGYISNAPCFIVTFKGIERPGRTSVRGQDPKIFTEYSVVVDAISNEVLYGFFYR